MANVDAWFAPGDAQWTTLGDLTPLPWPGQPMGGASRILCYGAHGNRQWNGSVDFTTSPCPQTQW